MFKIWKITDVNQYKHNFSDKYKLSLVNFASQNAFN